MEKNAVHARGRSPSRNTPVRGESPMTRNRWKQLEAEKKKGLDETTDYLKDDLLDFTAVDESIEAKSMNRIISRDNTKRLYDLIDAEQIPSKPITNNSYVRHIETNGNVTNTVHTGPSLFFSKNKPSGAY